MADIHKNAKEEEKPLGKPSKTSEAPENEKKDEKDIKIEELTELLKRTQADFINYRNRVEKETMQACEYANAEFIKRMLPVLDSFEFAFKSSQDPEKFRKGMEMIYAQLYDLLKQEGLSPIEAMGKKFDPYLHEVLIKEKSDKEEDIVIEELQKGYKLKDKVIRHSKVKLSG